MEKYYKVSKNINDEILIIKADYHNIKPIFIA